MTPQTIFASGVAPHSKSLRRVRLVPIFAIKHFQRINQRLRIVLTLINGRRRGAALEQKVDRFPRRADGAFDGQGYFPGNLDILADEPEIGRPLWNRGRPVATAPWQPDIVDGCKARKSMTP